MLPRGWCAGKSSTTRSRASFSAALPRSRNKPEEPTVRAVLEQVYGAILPFAHEANAEPQVPLLQRLRLLAADANVHQERIRHRSDQRVAFPLGEHVAGIEEQ